MGNGVGKIIGEIKRWYQGNDFRKWLFAYTLVSISDLASDKHGEVCAYNEAVFAVFTDDALLEKALMEAKDRYTKKMAIYYQRWRLGRQRPPPNCER